MFTSNVYSVFVILMSVVTPFLNLQSIGVVKKIIFVFYYYYYYACHTQKYVFELVGVFQANTVFKKLNSVDHK